MSFFDRFKKLIKKKEIENQIDQKKFKKLSLLFIENADKAIQKSTKYLSKSKKKTNDQFLSEIKSAQKSNSCTTAWSKPTLCGQCFDCQKWSVTNLCIECFLAGHHEEHNSIIFYDMIAGNCNCGNPSFIDPKGFCQKHPGPDPNPEMTQMTTEDREKFITVFKAAFYGAMHTDSDYNIEKAFNYIAQFIPYGDGIRRCASYAVVSVSKQCLYEKIPTMSEDVVGMLIDLFGKLVTDMYFLFKMSYLHFQNQENLFDKLKKCMIEKGMEDEYWPIKKFISFNYQYYVFGSINQIVHKSKFNWPDFLVNMIRNSIDIFMETNYVLSEDYSQCTLGRVSYTRRFLEAVLSIDEQHENIQIFIDKYSKLLTEYERLISLHVHEIPEDENDDGLMIISLLSYFSNVHIYFTNANELRSPKNKQFSISSVVNALITFCQKYEIKAESILNLQKKTNVSLFIPLHQLFYSLIQNYDNTQDLILNECKRNNIDFQEFCSMVLISPLRAIAASTFQSSKLYRCNHGNLFALKSILDQSHMNFCSYFGLIQTLIGIAPDKEKMMENVLITFGVFDDLNEFKETMNATQYDRQLFLNNNCDFEAATFFLSLLTDKSIISLDRVYFSRLRVIELLKKKRANADDIKRYVDYRIFYKQCFTDDLVEYMERISTTNGKSYFILKNEGDFTPFFPPINESERTDLLMKVKDNLAPILEYTELPRQISLKSCFRSPSFIALTFKMLSKSDIISLQVGFAMLASIVKNGEKYSPQSFKSQNPIFVSGQCLEEVISQLEKVHDKLEEVNVLTIQIQLEDKNPTSIVQLVQSNKQFGKLAIERIGLPISTNLQEEEEKYSKLIQEKKRKAALFKQQLLKQYQNKRNQFILPEQKFEDDNKPKQQEEEKQTNSNNNSDDDDIINDTNQDISNTANVCSICLTDKDDVFGFPCLSFLSGLSSVIDNKLHKRDNKCLTYDMKICCHLIHYKCYLELLENEMSNDEYSKIKSPLDQLYHCMMDRGKRNCFLPLFEECENPFTKTPSNKQKEAIMNFATRAFNKGGENNLKDASNSFAFIVLKLEVRLRKRPECLDSPDVSILLRNLLITIYHGFHQRACKYDIDIKSFENPLSKLIFEIIKSNDPVSAFCSIVQKISTDLEDDFLYEFLRRAAIVEDIAMNNVVSEGKFIDWDDVLSLSNLLERYHIKGKSDKEIELPLFETIKLPEKFINLYLPPYNIEISEYNKLIAVDLITGQVCRLPKSDENNFNYPLIEDYALNTYHNGLSMFLCLTGKEASSLIYYCNQLDKYWVVDGFYTDQFGDTDPGFKRGIISTLSKDRLEKALDNYLSGDLVLY